MLNLKEKNGSTKLKWQRLLLLLELPNKKPENSKKLPNKLNLEEIELELQDLNLLDLRRSNKIKLLLLKEKLKKLLCYFNKLDKSKLDKRKKLLD